MKKKFLGIPMGLLAFILIVAGVAAVVYTYNLNQDIPSSVTVTEPTQELESYLYMDLNCTLPFDGSITFGDVDLGETSTVILYFKSIEIDPATVLITADNDPAITTFTGIVGTPFSAFSWHPCVVTMSVTAVGLGTDNFTISITGTGP